MDIDELIEKLQQARNEYGKIKVVIRDGYTVTTNIDVVDVNNEAYGYDRISIVNLNNY